MYESGFDEGAVGGTDSSIRRFFGSGLILLGTGVAVWVLVSLIWLIAADSTPALAAAVVPEIDDPVVLGLPDEKFALPRQVFLPVGFLLVCFVYAIGAGLAATLINCGCSLFQPDLAKTIRQAVEKIERTRAHERGAAP